MRRKKSKSILITVEKENLDIIDNYCEDYLIPRSNLFEKAVIKYILERGYKSPIDFITTDEK